MNKSKNLNELIKNKLKRLKVKFGLQLIKYITILCLISTPLMQGKSEIMNKIIDDQVKKGSTNKTRLVILMLAKRLKNH